MFVFRSCSNEHGCNSFAFDQRGVWEWDGWIWACGLHSWRVEEDRGSGGERRVEGPGGLRVDVEGVAIFRVDRDLNEGGYFGGQQTRRYSRSTRGAPTLCCKYI